MENSATGLVPPPLAPPPRTATLQDLGPDDKAKVAKLLKQVVDLGQEVTQLKQQRDEVRWFEGGLATGPGLRGSP